MVKLQIALFAAIVAFGCAEVFLKEEFGAGWDANWVVSDWKKDTAEAGDWGHSAGEWYGDAEADKGLKTMDDARFYAISRKHTTFSNKGKSLVVQFSVKHGQKIDCGGAYMKLFPSSVDQTHLHGGENEDVYNIMFGPDICGMTKRTHLIFNYGGENLLIKKEIPCESDELTHLYTLTVNADNTYEVQIDGEVKSEGSLFESHDFLKPKTIKDPAVSKPSDWVDEKKIDDPEDLKPEGYDDIPAQITDPEATKPEDWDDEDDGEWEPPMIDNPEFQGEWKAKRIDNPDYVGEWEHPMIDNPDYVHDDTLYSYADFGVAAFEVWQVKAGTIFDNVIITDDPAEAKALADATFFANKDAEKDMYDAAQEAKRAQEEEERKAAEAAAADDDDDEDDDEDDEDEEKDEL